jgi:hypothetical protein
VPIWREKRKRRSEIGTKVPISKWLGYPKARTAILTAISQVAAIIIGKLQYIAIFYWSNNIAIIFNKYIFPRVQHQLWSERLM